MDLWGANPLQATTSGQLPSTIVKYSSCIKLCHLPLAHITCCCKNASKHLENHENSVCARNQFKSGLPHHAAPSTMSVHLHSWCQRLSPTVCFLFELMSQQTNTSPTVSAVQVKAGAVLSLLRFWKVSATRALPGEWIWTGFLPALWPFWNTAKQHGLF